LFRFRDALREGDALRFVGVVGITACVIRKGELARVSFAKKLMGTSSAAIETSALRDPDEAAISLGGMSEGKERFLAVPALPHP
jgi:hypothetical protein